MASKRMLVFSTMLFCLSFSTAITGLDPSKNLIIENGLQVVFNRGSHATNSSGNASSGSSIEAEQQTYITHNAGYQSKGVNLSTPWHGVRARINLWNIPDVQPLSSSGAYIAAVNKESGLEFIAAGFHVNPGLYNDNDMHFFTYWTTASDYSTGCYNNNCHGFFTADGSNHPPGQAIAPPLSTYGGEQRSITLRIKRDEKTGDWSLYREVLGGPNGGETLLGWWPGPLFKYLSDHAEIITWAGYVNYNINERSPSMGSGHFSSELDGKAASFIDCFGFDEFGVRYDDDYQSITYEDKPDCYDVSKWYDTRHSARRHFFYGGPGGCSQNI